MRFEFSWSRTRAGLAALAVPSLIWYAVFTIGQRLIVWIFPLRLVVALEFAWFLIASVAICRIVSLKAAKLRLPGGPLSAYEDRSHPPDEAE